MKLPLFYPFLIFLFSNLQSQINSFTTTQSFEAYISKEVFMKELNAEINNALSNQTFETNIPYIFNRSISSNLIITSINVTLNEFKTSNQSFVDSDSLYLKNCSINLNFSLEYMYNQPFKSSGKFKIEGCDFKLEYFSVNQTSKIILTILNISNFGFNFEDQTPITKILEKLVEANVDIIRPKCTTLLTNKLNDYFNVLSNYTFNMMEIKDFLLFYHLNLTKVQFSNDGINIKAFYSFYDWNHIKPNILTNPISFNELIPAFIKNIDAKNLKIPASIFQDAINIAHKQHYFNYEFNETNLQIPGFSFYVGDLSFALPSIASLYYPDTKLNIFCGSNDDSPPQFQVFFFNLTSYIFSLELIMLKSHIE